MKIFLDDIRRPLPELGWTWARSVNEARELFVTNTVTHASFDNDLGEYATDGGDVNVLVTWLAEQSVWGHDHWPTHGVFMHTSNSVEYANMLRTVDRFAHYGPGAGPRRGDFADVHIAYEIDGVTTQLL